MLPPSPGAVSVERGELTFDVRELVRVADDPDG
jgi:hypothetical protein